MQIIEKNITSPQSIREGDCFLDIETTGFFPRNHSIITIGQIDVLKNTAKLTQYFANSPEEEEELLKSFSEHFNRYTLPYTYNGDHFDIPFLNYKLNSYEINLNISSERTHDIYKETLSIRSILKLKNYKRDEVEKFFKISREEGILLAENIVPTYEEYLRSKELSLQNQILEHNQSELTTLIELTNRVYILKKSLQFYFPLFQSSLLLKKIKFRKKTATVEFDIFGDKSYPLSTFQDGISIHVKDGRLLLTFSTITGITSEQKSVISPIIRPSFYFKIEDIIIWENIIKLSQHLLLHEFCNK